MTIKAYVGKFILAREGFSYFVGFVTKVSEKQVQVQQRDSRYQTYLRPSRVLFCGELRDAENLLLTLKSLEQGRCAAELAVRLEYEQSVVQAIREASA